MYRTLSEEWSCTYNCIGPQDVIQLDTHLSKAVSAVFPKQWKTELQIFSPTKIGVILISK